METLHNINAKSLFLKKTQDPAGIWTQDLLITSQTLLPLTPTYVQWNLAIPSLWNATTSLKQPMVLASIDHPLLVIESLPQNPATLLFRYTAIELFLHSRCDFYTFQPEICAYICHNETH